MKKWQCQVCNYNHTGDDAPDSCPVCGAKRDLFTLISAGQDEAKADIEKPSKEAPADFKQQKCSVCGYIRREEDPSDKCPVCGAASENFQVVTSASDIVKTKTVESDDAEKQWKCTLCGYIHTGPTPPDKCPVCGADASLFVLLAPDEKKSTPKPVTQVEKKIPAPTSTPATEMPPQAAAAPSEPSPESSTVSQVYATLTKQLSKLHGHPISVHIPNGVLPVAFLFFLLGVIFHSDTLLLVSHYNLVFVLLAMPLVLFSGYNDWQIRLGGVMTHVIKVKMICGATVTISSLVLVFWRWVNPDIVEQWASGWWIYLAVFAVAMAAAAVAGFYGGKLIQFPGDDKF